MNAPLDIVIYLYILIGARFSENLNPATQDRYIKAYCPYTTSHVITNKEMYDVNKLIEEAFINNPD
jgi:hypothetical protein